MKITKENIIIYTAVLFASLLIAGSARFVALTAGVDNTSAAVVFWCAIVLCLFAYVSLSVVIESGFELLFKKKAPQAIIEEVVKEEVPTKEEPKEESAPKSNINVDEIRNTHLSSALQHKHAKLQVALDYVQYEFAPYVSDQDLKLLLESIELYSEGIIDIVTPVRTNELTNYDLYHFGWNIYNHFKVLNQSQSAEFIHQLFYFALKDIESASTIRKKFRNEEAKIIKLRGNLSPEQ